MTAEVQEMIISLIMLVITWTIITIIIVKERINKK